MFFELAEVNKEFEKEMAELAQRGAQIAAMTNQNEVSMERKAIAEEEGRVERWFEEKLIDVDKRHKGTPYDPLPYSYFSDAAWLSDSEGLRQYLHFHRHGESLQSSKLKDAEGDLEAYDRISRTERDFRILAFGKGPIKPFQEIPVHRQLLQIVMSYEKEPLSSEELADCFDAYCACGRESHDAAALRKMRRRLEANLKGSQSNPQPSGKFYQFVR